MANIQQQPKRPLMDHRLLKALIDGNPDEMLGDVLVPIDQEAANNPERLLQGATCEGNGVLHIAAGFGHVHLVNAISNRWRGAVDVAAKNKKGETALHRAAATGNVDMINLLISLAGDDAKKRQLLRQQRNNGETCLHEAVRCGRRDAVHVLVQLDVDYYVPDCSLVLVEIHNNEGVSPLYMATTLSEHLIVQFLTEHNNAYPAVSYDGPGSKTALHAAVRLSRDLSECLAAWNVELIGKADLSGNTPLHLLAATKDDTFIMNLLLDSDTNAGYLANEEASLPIHVAAANGNLEIVRLLSERCPGCRSSCNKFAKTVLHIAVQERRYDVVNYVSSERKFAGILNTTDIDGNTALHLAVLGADPLIFCQLMRNEEVSLSIRNKEEHTPLDLAQLNIPRGISLLQGRQHWVMYGLLVAGAEYGTCRSDSRATKPDDVEKESETIAKSAALVGVSAALLLTASFTVPFSVTTLYHNPDKDIKLAVGYNIFVFSDALAFTFSAVTISCSTLAGFYISDQSIRLFYLDAGAKTLCVAAMFIVLVFTSGMYVAVGPVAHLSSNVIACMLMITYSCIILPFMPAFGLARTYMPALISRLGFAAWCRAVIRQLQSQFLFIIAMIVALALLVGIATVFASWE